jgi:DNA-binding transcriptional LysR family regulator
MMQAMEIRHLLTFVTAAESRSFTRAGETLGLTQAAVSQHVRALERELRTALFDRGPRSVTLTGAGQRVYDQARRILALVDDIRREVGQQPDALGGTIRIASSTVPSEWLLPELLAKFRALYPGVQESVCVFGSEGAIRAVESGAAELGFVGEPPRAGTLSARSVARDELILVVGPGHEFARRTRIPQDALRGQPLIVRELGSASRRCVEQALAQAGLPMGELRAAMEINANDAIRASVERGLGVAFLSRRSVSREIRDQRLVPVEIEGLRVLRELYLITDPQRLPTRVVRAFLEVLEELGNWPD